MKPIQIYGLVDPRDNQFFYVGRSCDVPSRVRQHFINPSSKALRERMNEIGRSGFASPNFVILETASDDWRIGEQYWIDKLRDEGAHLLNVQKGGVGASEAKRISFVDTVTVRFTKEEKEMLQSISTKLGITNRADIIRMALRRLLEAGQ